MSGFFPAATTRSGMRYSLVEEEKREAQIRRDVVRSALVHELSKCVDLPPEVQALLLADERVTRELLRVRSLGTQIEESLSREEDTSPGAEINAH